MALFADDAGDGAGKIINAMWEEEKRSMKYTVLIWEQRDAAQKFIIDLANNWPNNEASFQAREWLIAHDLKWEIRPNLRHFHPNCSWPKDQISPEEKQAMRAIGLSHAPAQSA